MWYIIMNDNQKKNDLNATILVCVIKQLIESEQ